MSCELGWKINVWVDISIFEWLWKNSNLVELGFISDEWNGMVWYGMGKII